MNPHMTDDQLIDTLCIAADEEDNIAVKMLLGYAAERLNDMVMARDDMCYFGDEE